MGKYKKYIWMAGLCCALPLTGSGAAGGAADRGRPFV